MYVYVHYKSIQLSVGKKEISIGKKDDLFQNLSFCQMNNFKLVLSVSFFSKKFLYWFSFYSSVGFY